MKSISRKEFINRISLSTVGVVGLSQFGFKPFSNHLLDTDTYVHAETTHGKLRGIRREGVNIFKGIPYAGSVSGERRFRRPAPLKPWTGVRDALKLGAPSIQPPLRNQPAPAEDCLFLNVWTPANDNKKRPVMFYNHGGGYVVGSGGTHYQDGANLARKYDVVVVETNHRLGLLGFLYMEELGGIEYAGSGNNGMLDIIDGLKWVNENITEFGGDPYNVMIFGESGGGGKTSCLYAMPEADRYFNKASIESGPGLRMLKEEWAVETTAKVLKELNISKNNWRKLLDVPADKLLKIQQSKFHPVPPYQVRRASEGGPGRKYLGFGPVVDDVALLHNPFDPTAPKISNKKPLMTGWNEDTWIFFAMQEHDTAFAKYTFDELPSKLSQKSTFAHRFSATNAKKLVTAYREAMPNASAANIYVAIKSIAMMGLGSIAIAERETEQMGAPVYLYNFGYKSNLKVPGTNYPMGTPHAMEIVFKFDNMVHLNSGKKQYMGMAGTKPNRFIAARHMSELWTTFARTGRPAAKGVPEWPAYNLVDRPLMRIDVDCKVIDNRFQGVLPTWRSMGWMPPLPHKMAKSQ